MHIAVNEVSCAAMMDAFCFVGPECRGGTLYRDAVGDGGDLGAGGGHGGR